MKNLKLISFSSLAFLSFFAFSSDIAKANPLPTDFDQVPDYAKSTIEEMYIQNKLAGFEDGTFKPNQLLTRAEFVAMLLRAYDFEADETLFEARANGNLTITDSAQMTDWQLDVMTTAFTYGLISGIDTSRVIYVTNDERKEVYKTTLNANSLITREEMASMLIKALSSSLYSYDDFEDTDNYLNHFSADDYLISDWAKKAVANTVKFKLMSGTDINTFSPSQLGTRTEAAILFNRLEKHIDSTLKSFPAEVVFPNNPIDIFGIGPALQKNNTFPFNDFANNLIFIDNTDIFSKKYFLTDEYATYQKALALPNNEKYYESAVYVSFTDSKTGKNKISDVDIFDFSRTSYTESQALNFLSTQDPDSFDEAYLVFAKDSTQASLSSQMNQYIAASNFKFYSIGVVVNFDTYDIDFTPDSSMITVDAAKNIISSSKIMRK